MHPSGQSNLLHVSFNQDSSCFVCGTSNGFFVCNSNPFKERFRREFDVGGIGIVEYLHRTNILALVGGGKVPQYAPNKVMIWDDHQVRCIAELAFASTVKAVRLRKDRIIVVLSSKVYTYDFTDLNLLDQIDTAPNDKGLCAVSSDKDMVLATLGEAPGKVRVETFAKNQSHLGSIDAHNTALSAIAMNAKGTRLATASEKGTIIRVWNITDPKNITKEKEFRRGSSPATIYSLAFNDVGTILCCSSSNKTVHIMSCDTVTNLSNQQSSFSSLKSYLPFAGDEWSARQIHLADETHCICAIPQDEGDKHVIIVLAASGKYYRYCFSGNEQECTKVSELNYFTPSLQ